MPKTAPSRHDQERPFLPVAARVLVCLWIGAVIGLYLLLFFPVEYLYSSEVLDIRAWVLAARYWLGPFFRG